MKRDEGFARIERARILLMIAQEQCRLFGTWYKSISRNVIRFAREQETKDLKPIIQSSRRIHLLCHQNLYVNARIYLISFMAFRFTLSRFVVAFACLAAVARIK